MWTLFEDVTDSANRVNQFRGEPVIDLAPKTGYGHVDHVGVAVKMDVPDELGNLCARQDLPPVPRHEGEQAELFRGKHELLAAAPGAMADQVKLEIRHPHGGGLMNGAAPQHGANARQQFRERKGLEEVIISAEFKALDAVGHRIARGE